MKCYRRILRISWRDMIRNEDIQTENHSRHDQEKEIRIIRSHLQNGRQETGQTRPILENGWKVSKRTSLQRVARWYHRMGRTKWTRLVPPRTRPAGMEESDPVNGWPQRALSLWEMMMMMIKHRRRILSSYRCSRSEDDRNLLRSMNTYIHREFNAVKRAQWQKFCLGLEPKNTHRFWNHCKNLFKKRAPDIQGFWDDTTGRLLTDPNFMIEHAHRYYSQAFKERETTSQNQDATEFKRTLTERLAELPSQPFLFKIADLHRSIHRVETKTSSCYEKIFNDLLIRSTYPEHWKLSKMILIPKGKSSTISCALPWQILRAMFSRLSYPVDEDNWCPSTRTIRLSGETLNSNTICAISPAHKLQSSTSISSRLLINSDMSVFSTSCTKWIVRMN